MEWFFDTCMSLEGHVYFRSQFFVIFLSVNWLQHDFRIDRSNIPAMCSHNAKAASAVGRRDLVQVGN